MFGPVEIVGWIVLSILFIGIFAYTFYRFTGRGKRGEAARREGVRHEGIRD